MLLWIAQVPPWTCLSMPMLRLGTDGGQETSSDLMIHPVDRMEGIIDSRWMCECADLVAHCVTSVVCRSQRESQTIMLRTSRAVFSALRRIPPAPENEPAMTWLRGARFGPWGRLFSTVEQAGELRGDVGGLSVRRIISVQNLPPFGRKVPRTWAHPPHFRPGRSRGCFRRLGWT